MLYTMMEIWLKLIEEEIEASHFTYPSMTDESLRLFHERYEKEHDLKEVMKAFNLAVDLKVPVPTWVPKALDKSNKFQKYRPLPDDPQIEFMSLIQLKTKWKGVDDITIAQNALKGDLGYYVISGKWMSKVAQAAREKKIINYQGWTWVDSGEITFQKLLENLDDLAFTFKDVLEFESAGLLRKNDSFNISDEPYKEQSDGKEDTRKLRTRNNDLWRTKIEDDYQRLKKSHPDESHSYYAKNIIDMNPGKIVRVNKKPYKDLQRTVTSWIKQYISKQS